MTKTTRVVLPILILAAALIAVFGAVAAGTSRGEAAYNHGAKHQHGPRALTQKQVALREDMRRLWEDHITWTRLAIISLTTDSPDTQATVGRLLKNQTDIGNAVKPFYGRKAGNELTNQLRRHILIAAEVIAAAKAGDSDKLAEAQARWARNGNDIAAVLASVNPYWKLGAMKAELRTHLRLTTAEVVARLKADWSGDVAAYEKIHTHALHLSDALSDGLIKQFPRRFR